MLEPTQICVELVTRNESGSDAAGDRLQFVVTDQCANVVLGAAELGCNLADCQGFGPLHGRSIAPGGDGWNVARKGLRFTSSNIPWIKAGMRVVYTDAANFGTTPPMLDTDVVLSAGHGSAADGHVTRNLATAQGTVTFDGGTGAFATFRGSANVTVDANGVWHWDGTYSFGSDD